MNTRRQKYPKAIIYILEYHVFVYIHGRLCVPTHTHIPAHVPAHTRARTRTDTDIQICLYQYLCFYPCVSSASVVCRETPLTNTRFHSVFIMKINLQSINSVGIDLSSMNCLFNSSLLRFFAANVNINFVRGNLGN